MKKILLFILFIFSCSFVYAAPSDNIVSYHSFDADPNDDGAGGYDYTNNGAANVAALINNGYDFHQPDNDYMLRTGTNYTDFDGWGAFTVNLWCKYDTFNTSASIWEDMTNNKIQFDVQGGTGKWRTYHHDGVDWRETNAWLVTGQWYMMTYVWNGTGGQLYQNGTEVDNHNAIGANDVNSGESHIGADTGLANFGDFIIDELGVWDVALNQSDIDKLYNNHVGCNAFSGNCDNASMITSVSLTYPNSTQHYNTNWNLSIITDADYNATCEINDSDWTLDSDNETRYMWTNNTLITEGNLSFVVNCTDAGSYSANVSFWFLYDLSEPVITYVYPALDNSTDINDTNRTFCLDIYTEDDYLYLANLTIYNASGTVMYNNYSGDVTGQTRYNWTHCIDMTNQTHWQHGRYTVSAEATDSHTAKLIPSFEPTKNTTEKKLEYNTPEEWGNQKISIQLKDSSVDLIDFYDIKKVDRHSSYFDFEKQLGLKTYTFTVKSDKALKHLKGTGFNAHLVTAEGMRGVWFDANFEGDKTASYKVSKISDYEYDILITTDVNTLIFDSMGGLNYNNVNATFDLQANLTIWVNDTNTGTYLENFTVSIPAINRTWVANGTNVTLFLDANESYNIDVTLAPYLINGAIIWVGWGHQNLTFNASSSGTTLYFYDEITGSLMNGIDVDIEIIGNTTGTFTTNTGSQLISGLSAGDYTAVYSADGYLTRSYPIELVLVGVYNYTLYLLNSSASGANTILANVYSETGVKQEGYTLRTMRTVAGEWTLVEISVTNYDGQTDFKAQTNTPIYYWIIEKDNTTYLTTTHTEVYATELDFYISLTEPTGRLYRLQGNMQYELLFDNNSNSFNLTYNDLSSSMTHIALQVYEMPDYNIVAQNTSTSVSGFLSVDMTNIYKNGTTYIARMLTNYSEASYFDSLSQTYPEAGFSIGRIGLLVTAFIMILFAFVGFWNPAVMFIMEGFAFLLTRVANLHEFSYVPTTVTVVLLCLIAAYIVSDRS